MRAPGSGVGIDARSGCKIAAVGCILCTVLLPSSAVGCILCTVLLLIIHGNG
jgi:hypothetical protein